MTLKIILEFSQCTVSSSAIRGYMFLLFNSPIQFSNATTMLPTLPSSYPDIPSHLKNRIEPADDANGEPDAAVDGSNAADPIQQAHVDTGANSQGQGEQTQEGYITIVDGQEEVVEEEEPHKADYGGGSGGDSWVDQDDALLAQPSVQQHQQKHQGQQQQQQYPQHGAASSLEAAAPTMPRQQQALASANARQKPEAYTESRTRPPTAIPKPKHSRPSLVTPGQNSSAVRGSSRHTGLIQSILMKHRKSQSDADVRRQRYS